MSWQMKDQHLDKALGRHYVTLHKPETGAEHHLIVLVGHDSCPACGHVTPKDNVGDLDFKAILKSEMAALEESHAQAHKYAAKHGVPVLRADGSKR